jgi:hypothetical protein
MRAVLLALLLAGCATIDTVRLQAETVDVGPGLRPIAGIQATVTTFYLFFIPIPGDVSLDHVVNRMLIVTAKTLGADKVTNLGFHLECPGACLSKIFGTVLGTATGVAVQVVGPAADPLADEGPEGPAVTRR